MNEVPRDHRPAHRRPPRRRGSRDERGITLSTEFVLLLPALVVVIGLLIGGGRLALARITVQQWADSASRAATLARDAGSARAQAHDVVAGDAAQAGLRCAGGWTLTLEASAFSRPVGQAGEVTATVACRVPFGDLLLPGMPGEFVVEGRASSTLDSYRGRR